MVSKVLLGVIGILMVASYYFYSQNQILVANNASLKGAVATQEEAIKYIQEDFKLQTQQLQDLTVKSQIAQRELNRYTQFIQNYELTAKIIADPVEMQRKINNGTKHIMENIEQISSDVDGLDDGLQLQPTSN
jgi:cell fate (sporulation/competence/biofilm development) regulator YlbF (YheA/YmcA/DUF963 family)